MLGVLNIASDLAEGTDVHELVWVVSEVVSHAKMLPLLPVMLTSVVVSSQMRDFCALITPTWVGVEMVNDCTFESLSVQAMADALVRYWTLPALAATVLNATPTMLGKIVHVPPLLVDCSHTIDPTAPFELSEISVPWQMLVLGFVSVSDTGKSNKIYVKLQTLFSLQILSLLGFCPHTRLKDSGRRGRVG